MIHRQIAHNKLIAALAEFYIPPRLVHDPPAIRHEAQPPL